ncbi:MarR family transcriptional regulator [Cellulomonas chitinilytica]|uniref:MarR family transcriptional regulator n=1 Tax=Cellulomonas chitinilytica TaxID=398759 RepID=A0A919P5Y1_9CELL|nr:MarR family transcriptional regulator [Cellulomonas chitinilytica]GIG22558.1 MarR family transcriptional regulator [Cellulomonas chitinilytica]
MTDAVAAPVEDPLAVEAQVCLTVSAAARSLVGFYRPLLAPLGLTHPQYLAMLALWQYERLSLKELAALLHLEPATTSPLVRRLEAMRLVRRERDPDDERALAIVLTDAGRAMRDSAVDIPATMVERLGLERAQIDEIRRAAELLVAACAAAAPQD